jgi:hypothetical protein
MSYTPDVEDIMRCKTGISITIEGVEDIDEAVEILNDIKTDGDVLSALQDPSIVTIPFEGGEIEKTEGE